MAFEEEVIFKGFENTALGESRAWMKIEKLESDGEG
jgi:hypothetical protein